MKPRQLVAATALAFAAFASTAQADLVSDLQTMSVAEALAKAVKTENISIEALIADAAAQLSEQPGLLSSLVSEAIKAFPEQAVSIVSIAIKQAPEQVSAITSAALTELDGNAEAQAAVQQVAEQSVAQTETETSTQTETEAEQTEAPAETSTTTPVTAPPPPPPASRPDNNDKPVPVSPN
ncbi:hypothetical protein ACH42_02430 [Endozoicomonas sp. (ex Bugula neritina AB1)]|nr:hypothetical protein ACH42_02430 [Endozoicomonas sp. (ex Bugula neritina AB1)]